MAKFSLSRRFYVVVGAVAISLGATSAFAVTPYQATYSFAYQNKNVGTATRNLERYGQGWRYTFSAQIPIFGTASEVSLFNVNNKGQVQSTAFSRSSRILGKQQLLTLAFQPTNKSIAVNNNNKTSSYTWRAGVLDELNAEIQMREDLKKNAMKSSYLISDRKGIDTIPFVKEGNERVSTPLGQYDTIRVRLKHDDNSKSSVFWLAPSLDYLPVKMSHRDDKTTYTLTLKQYQPK